jgi:hypothetical protein
MEQADLDSLVEIFGEPFIQYVLAVDGDTSQLLQDECLSQAARTTVLQVLIALLESGNLSDDPFHRQSTLSSWLATPVAGSVIPLAHGLRQLSGGELPAPPTTSDQVLRRLYEVLRDGYPSLLLPVTGQRGIGPRLSVAFDNPGKQALEEAVLSDPVLQLLFPTKTENGGWMGYIQRSSGSGGSIQLWMFAEQQITLAWEQACLRYAVPTLEQVAETLAANLKVVRHVVSGKKSTIPMLVGLTGVLLPDSLSELDLGLAKLRKASESDRSLASRTGLEGKLQTTTPTGDTVVIDYAGDLVLELPLTYEVVVSAWDPHDDSWTREPWPDHLRWSQESVAAMLETIRLALVLALDTEAPVNIVSSWQVVLDPLEHLLSPGWSDTRQVPNLIPKQLTGAEASDWLDWVKRVHEHRTPSVAVAIRRMLQAIAERRSPDDVLVDAVIVWENLFGAAVETTLRVTSSMAWLLGDDAADRANKQKEYKDLYAARSGIVHGSLTKAKSAQLAEQAHRTVAISRAALRTVFRDRTDLLHINSSEKRSLAMMLGATPKKT